MDNSGNPPNVTIGPGRIYVDGLLAENHGKMPGTFNSVLAEMYGDAIPYNKQPYRPDSNRDLKVRSDLPDFKGAHR